MSIKHSVVRSKLVINELDRVTCLDVESVGLESQHSGVCAELHFNSGSIGCANPKT